jgi:hypothetical protein
MGEHLEGVLHALGREAAVLVHASAQAGDFSALADGLEAAIGLAVGDEQEDRIGPYVDGGVTRHSPELIIPAVPPTSRWTCSRA